MGTRELRALYRGLLSIRTTLFRQFSHQSGELGAQAWEAIIRFARHKRVPQPLKSQCVVAIAHCPLVAGLLAVYQLAFLLV